MTKETAVFGGGCFWCTEAIFLRLNGVISAIPGYAGGTVENPSYDQVSMGNTNHAEVVKIEFDSEVLSYEELLDIFFHTHDPTTLNKQGADEGTQYRSAVFYSSDEQKKRAEIFIKKLEASKEFTDQIVTTLEPLTKFYEAEDYHKNYFETHKNAPYCQIVIAPKVHKLEDLYKEKLKE